MLLVSRTGFHGCIALQDSKSLEEGTLSADLGHISTEKNDFYFTAILHFG